MKIGFVGLGKLGLPVAVTMQRFGHEVMGTDLDATRMHVKKHPEAEEGLTPGESFNDMLAKWPIAYGTLSQVVEHATVIFVAIQTPHLPMYSGATRLPKSRADFNYVSLRRGLSAVFAEIATARGRGIMMPKTVAIISTVLPGTMRRIISRMAVPVNVQIAYTPQFIAMGTVVKDFANPEFILIGQDSPNVYLREAFDPVVRQSGAPYLAMSIASAEVTKVGYNTFITAKITISNLLGQVCHETRGADIDDVSNALRHSTRRIAGPDYLRSGMGDGGGCHPRDNIAMSWLAGRLGLHADLFTGLMDAREYHARWYAKLIYDLSFDHGRNVTILGYAFKPNTALADGSHALLLGEILTNEFTLAPSTVDPFIDKLDLETTATRLENLQADIIFVGCAHDIFRRLKFPKRAVVIDPFRFLDPTTEESLILPIGKGGWR